MEKFAATSLVAGFLVAAASLHAAPQIRANGLFESDFARPPAFKQAGADGFRTKESGNGLYQCRYKYHDNGNIHSLELNTGDKRLFSMPETGAQSLEVSNAGLVLLTRIDWSTEAPSRFTFYSRDGSMLMDRACRYPGFSRFSERGDYFGVCARESLEVIHPATGSVKKYRTGKSFDISEDGSVIAVAYESGVAVYTPGRPVREIPTGYRYNRGIEIAPGKDRLAVIDIRHLRVYGLPDLRPLLSDSLDPGESFRQIRFAPADTLWAGVKFENQDHRRGILKAYGIRSLSPSRFLRKDVKAEEPVGKSGLDLARFRRALPKKAEGPGSPNPYRPIPWPFRPQDRPHRLWNNYEGLNASEDGIIDSINPYLHQGLDMEADAHTPVYSVDTGIVKYHGDMGGSGDLFWRIAVSRTQSAGFSTGWLYAHLEKNSINYDVGDRIPAVGLHIGDIVPWYGNVSGHLHFNEIRDQGTTWSYSDGEWGITFNPQLALFPNPDTARPVIVQAIAGKSRFAYCRNNSGFGARPADYFFPDSARGGVRGDIDIVVRLYDFIVYDNFTQPAHKIEYWIKGLSRGPYFNQLIKDTTLAQVRNHAYDFYSVARFKPASEVLYKADSVFTVGGWFNRTRTFAHILTNNNGDTLLTPGERDSSLHTARHPDGWYRVHIRAWDLAGNSAVDSEAVYFNNGRPTGLPGSEDLPERPAFLGSTRVAGTVTIRYYVPSPARVSLGIRDLDGRENSILASGWHEAGEYSVPWKGFPGSRTGMGMRLLVLRSGKSRVARILP